MKYINFIFHRKTKGEALLEKWDLGSYNNTRGKQKNETNEFP